MEALKTPALQVLSSTGFRESAQGGHGGVSFSSSAVCGAPFRKQVITEAARVKKVKQGNGKQGNRSGAVYCVAATATDESVGSSSDTLYSVLGVESGGSFSAIKSAYRQMARRYHPDVCPDDDSATQRFLEVRHAYEVLSDPEKRADYDYALMHPSFAQALANGSNNNFSPRRRSSRRTQGSEGASDAWRLQWEAQLSRLRRRESDVTSNSNSWGARMRRANLSEHENLVY